VIIIGKVGRWSSDQRPASMPEAGWRRTAAPPDVEPWRQPEMSAACFHIGKTRFRNVKCKNAAAQQAIPLGRIVFRIMEYIHQLIVLIEL
jgi:hypothetical protein